MIFQVQHFEYIDSTNAYLKRLISENNTDYDGLVIIADEQSAGVGKLGRAWHSPKGNLFFSLALKQGEVFKNFNDLSTLSLLCSSATRRAITHFVPDNQNISIKCKWPNDILVNGEKISGMLLELAYNPQGEAYLIIGIGVNITSSPNIANYKTTYLLKYLKDSISETLSNTLSNTLSATDFANILMEKFLQLFSELKLNPQLIINDWKQFAYLLGDEIKIKLGDDVLQGTFIDLDQNGYLILNINNTLQKITAGEIFNIPLDNNKI